MHFNKGDVVRLLEEGDGIEGTITYQPRHDAKKISIVWRDGAITNEQPHHLVKVLIPHERRVKILVGHVKREAANVGLIAECLNADGDKQALLDDLDEMTSTINHLREEMLRLCKELRTT